MSKQEGWNEKEENKSKAYFSCLCNECNIYKFGKCRLRGRNIKKITRKYFQNNQNNAECLFNKAITELVTQQVIDGYQRNEYLDSIGIDFMLTKYIKQTCESDGKRLLLPIQVKSSEHGANGHRHKYPYIPIMVINPDDEIEDIKKRIIAVFLETFKESAYHSFLLAKFNGKINI